MAIQLETKALGTIDVIPEQILNFPDGLFGFREHTEFALLEESSDSPFKWLQSVKDRELAFIVMQPELFMKKEGYRPVIAQADLFSLGVEKIDECLVLVIVTIPHDKPESMTANLQGPVLINTKRKLGRQAISNQEAHKVRVSIMEQLEG
jgi:flagellar assembly factor FliW